MDTLGSLALATENPAEDLLDRKPHTRDDYIISKTMFKHIIGQAIFMFTMLLILVFLGDKFIPEYEDAFDSIPNFKPEYKYSTPGTIRSGRSIFISGEPDYDTILNETGIFSRHFTFVFNAFVMMQVFNFVNCRKIQDEVLIFLIPDEQFRRNHFKLLLRRSIDHYFLPSTFANHFRRACFQRVRILGTYSNSMATVHILWFVNLANEYSFEIITY